MSEPKDDNDNDDDDLEPIEVDDVSLKWLEDAARDDASRPPIQPPGDRDDRGEGSENGSSSG